MMRSPIGGRSLDTKASASGCGELEVVRRRADLVEPLQDIWRSHGP